MLPRSAETARTRAQMNSECSLLLSPPPFVPSPPSCPSPLNPILEHTSVLPRGSDEERRIPYYTVIDFATFRRFQGPPSNPIFYHQEFLLVQLATTLPFKGLFLFYKSMLFGAKARRPGYLIISLVDSTGHSMFALSFWGLSTSNCL